VKLTPENTTRKIDSLGRVSIPKSMRSRLGIEDGAEMAFYLLEDDVGTQYVCLKADGEEIDPRYLIAEQVLDELGCEIPAELLAML
jgi:AbrB family looped-hinge helix DNA binding protein